MFTIKEFSASIKINVLPVLICQWNASYMNGLRVFNFIKNTQVLYYSYCSIHVEKSKEKEDFKI